MVHSVYGGGRRGLGGVGVFLPLDFVNLLRYIVLSRAGADFFSGLGGALIWLTNQITAEQQKKSLDTGNAQEARLAPGHVNAQRSH